MGSPATYTVFNGPMATTAAPTKVTTGTAIKTLLQIKAPTTPTIRVISWGISFDASAAATPGVVELVETDVAATVTAYVAADVQKYGDPNAPTSSITLGTSASGYTSSSEGSTTASRLADLQLIDPVAGYSREFTLDREFTMTAARFLRVRVTFGTAVNALCWVTYQEG